MLSFYSGSLAAAGAGCAVVIAGDSLDQLPGLRPGGARQAAMVYP